ncbi:MAG: NUDIX hydrolase [Armatimonadetes bacterium]|nr:NUDIX hydrolase [Armatimonadota bacterium]
MICSSPESERIYDGRVISLRLDRVRLPDGRAFQREIIEHNGAVGIVALTDDAQIVLVRQYRAPVEAELLEIPAGTLNKGEDPRDCAARELTEETNLAAGSLERMFFSYLAPGYSTEGMHFFLARDLRSAQGQQDEDEDVRVEMMPFERALEMALAGQIHDVKTVAALLFTARLNLQER